MPLYTAQRHQIEQEVITAAQEAERFVACDDAVALLRKIKDAVAAGNDPKSMEI